MQFVTSMTNNIEALTGSPVKVTITNYTSGSVIVATQTDFLDNNQASATSFSNLLTSGDVSSVFGTEYGSVTVDPKSVTTSQVTNPASKYSELPYASSVNCRLLPGTVHSYREL